MFQSETASRPKKISALLTDCAHVHRITDIASCDSRFGRFGCLRCPAVISLMLSAEALDTLPPPNNIEATYLRMRHIRALLNNARFDRARQVQEWLARPDSRTELHFVPIYCPRLTHNKSYETCKTFGDTVLTFPAVTCRRSGENSAIKSPTTSGS